MSRNATYPHDADATVRGDAASDETGGVSAFQARPALKAWAGPKRAGAYSNVSQGTPCVSRPPCSQGSP